jgi:hypothetical protein
MIRSAKDFVLSNFMRDSLSQLLQYDPNYVDRWRHSYPALSKQASFKEIATGCGGEVRSGQSSAPRGRFSLTRSSPLGVGSSVAQGWQLALWLARVTITSQVCSSIYPNCH